MSQDPTFIVYFSSTHWDREWYRPFQTFRFHLTKILSDVIDVLEKDSKFTRFILDGQTCMLEDYLEAMPQNQSRIEKLVKDGRLLIGPWYTMPDENLVSGEFLIQNLLVGYRYTEKFASGCNVLPVGYLCDIFGHIAQMPQILDGFHLNSAILGRGTNNYECPAFFKWYSPNGSNVITYKVPEYAGYGTFWYDVFFNQKADIAIPTEEMIEHAKTYVRNEMRRTDLPYVVLMDGMDHEPIHPSAPIIAEKIAEEFNCRVEIGGISELFKFIREGGYSLTCKYGELQQTAKDLGEHHNLIPGTLSSRYDIKRMNDYAQNFIEKSTMPLVALAKMRGTNLPYALLDVAYREMLRNHAHDSICGCSVDEVHQDMMYRYRQAISICKELCENTIFKLCTVIPFSNITKEKGLKLTVLNTLAIPVCGYRKVSLYFPVGYSHVCCEQIPSEPINQFCIFDSEGKELPYQILSISKGTAFSFPGIMYPEVGDHYELMLPIEIPAMGYSEFVIEPAQLPVRYFGTLKTSELSCENKFIRLSIMPSGEVCLEDKHTGQVFENILGFVDSGETGDGWYNRKPVPDRIVHSVGSIVSVETLEDGPLLCSFCVSYRMQLPKEMEYHRQYTRRSEKTENYLIRTVLSVCKDNPYLHCHVEVQNTVCDHRLSMSIRTGIDSDEYTVDQPFAFVKRRVDIDLETYNWKEPEKREKSFGNIVHRRRQNGNGVAIITKFGLHECAAHPGFDGRLDFTLLRTFSKTFLTDGQPDGQLLGTYTYEALICPISNDTMDADLIRVRDLFQTELFHFSSLTKPSYRPQKSKIFGLSLESEHAVLSVFKHSQNNSYVARIVNYSDEQTSAKLNCPVEFKKAFKADLLEQPYAELSIKDEEVNVIVQAYEIITIILATE